MGHFLAWSASPLFKEGRHYGHLAGTDLTGKLEGVPHGVEVLCRSELWCGWVSRVEFGVE